MIVDGRHLAVFGDPSLASHRLSEPGMPNGRAEVPPAETTSDERACAR